MWIEFSEVKPVLYTNYLVAINNWKRKDIRGNHIHSYDVRMAYWNGTSFMDGTHCIENPDQWARIPFPEKALKPNTQEF